MLCTHGNFGLKQDEKDKHERAKQREQQRKRQTLMDQRDNLESMARVTNGHTNRSSMSLSEDLVRDL